MQGTLPRVLPSIFGTAVALWRSSSHAVGSAVDLRVSRWVSFGSSVAPTPLRVERATVLSERSGSCLARKITNEFMVFHFRKRPRAHLSEGIPLVLLHSGHSECLL